MNTTTCVKILNKTEAALSPYLSVLERLLDDLSKYPMTVIREKVHLRRTVQTIARKQWRESPEYPAEVGARALRRMLWPVRFYIKK